MATSHPLVVETTLSLRVEADDLLHVNDYVLERELGTGAFGEVVLARHVPSGRRVVRARPVSPACAATCALARSFFPSSISRLPSPASPRPVSFAPWLGAGDQVLPARPPCQGRGLRRALAHDPDAPPPDRE